MTWVEVVKFWAYQAYQLQLIVYTNLTLTIPGLELFSLVSRQWGRCMSETFNGYPIAFNTEPIVIGMHYGTQTDVNVVASSALGSNHDSDKASVNWIAIGL